MVNREYVLEKWRDLKETVLIKVDKVEVYEEHIEEQNREIDLLKTMRRNKREKINNDLTELINNLEEKRKIWSVGIVLDYFIAEIKCLLPDEPQPPNQSSQTSFSETYDPNQPCSTCGLAKSSCTCIEEVD